jgi:sugar phosphate isomerase/epimerase
MAEDTVSQRGEQMFHRASSEPHCFPCRPLLHVVQRIVVAMPVDPSAVYQCALSLYLGASFDDARSLGCTYATSSVPQGWLSSMDLPDPNMTDEQKKEFLAKTRGSMLAPLTAEKVKVLADDMNKVGEAAKKAGLKFAAHNHTMEFASIDGKPAYDYLISHTDKDLVNFEIDCGWMVVAGYKPAQFIDKYPGRVKMLHIKDFLPYPAGASTGGPVRPEGSEIGQGVINYKEIFASVKGKGIQHIFVEQEGPYSRMPALKAADADYKYLHALS